MNDIRVAELFAGIGGFRLGLETAKARSDIWQHLAHIEGEQSRQQSYRVVWANEIDKYACQIYRKNFGEKELIEGDIRKIKADDIPDIDMLVGGFPCQPFSMAGKRKGFKDIRGTLFFEIVRIAAAKRPKLLFLENVKGLLNHDNGDTFETIVRTLDELGYNVEWKVLNSKYFGVPQNRERVFIIGHLREGSAKQVFPITSDDSEDCSCGEVAGTLTGGGHSGGLHSNMTAILSHSPRTNDSKLGGSGPLLSNEHCFTVDSTPHMVIETAQALQTDGMLRHGSSFGTNNPQSSRNIRRLTPTECERLQGFPDGWTEGVSDTQRYKCMGNAVTVPVIQAIGELILEALD